MNIFNLGLTLEDAVETVRGWAAGQIPGNCMDELELNSLHIVLDAADRKVDEQKIQIGGF